MNRLLSLFETDDREQTGLSQAAGGIGVWLLHLAKVAFLVYSGAHTINAALSLAGTAVPAKVAQVVGIIVVELVLFGLYLAYVNRQLTGSKQLIAAGVTYAIGFALACLGILADSQLNSRQALDPFLMQYLLVGLPVSPALMSLGAIVVHILAPDQLRAIERDRGRVQLATERFKAAQMQERLEMQEENARQALKVLSKQALLHELAHVFESPDFARAVKRAAVEKAPALFAEAGIVLDQAALQERPGPTGANELSALLRNQPELLAALDQLGERGGFFDRGRQGDAGQTNHVSDSAPAVAS